MRGARDQLEGRKLACSAPLASRKHRNDTRALGGALRRNCFALVYQVTGDVMSFLPVQWRATVYRFSNTFRNWDVMHITSRIPMVP